LAGGDIWHFQKRWSNKHGIERAANVNVHESHMDVIKDATRVWSGKIVARGAREPGKCIIKHSQAERRSIIAKSFVGAAAG
jgi:hypothetical protein